MKPGTPSADAQLIRLTFDLWPVKSRPFFSQKDSHKWERKTLPQGVPEILCLKEWDKQMAG